jgi:tRNA pseudouridine38-40 synthase
MPRYFIELSYKGTAYSGFQIQKNSITIQSELEKALEVFFKKPFALTGASRTDSGVHALQNFFHFDTDQPSGINMRGGQGQSEITSSEFSMEDMEQHLLSGQEEMSLKKCIYNINSILPYDIAIKRIFRVDDKAHCRFDAIYREYKYFIYRDKNPFLQHTAYYYPYQLSLIKLNEAASLLLGKKDFTSFSKKNTQVKNFICDVQQSQWIAEESKLVYHVKANRFLRGMVKAMVGTMLRVGTGKITLNEFNQIIEKRDCLESDFSVPSHALFLIAVKYKQD